MYRGEQVPGSKTLFKPTNMKHKLTEIHTKENSLLVEKSNPETPYEYPLSEYNDDGERDKFAYAARKEGNIIASTHRIDPSVPLYRPEDLKVKERYVPRQDTGDRGFWFIYDSTMLNSHDGLFSEKSKAQDYCNYLNRQHEVVDVEALADKRYPDRKSYSNDYKRTLMALREAFIEGYSAAPKHGWSDEVIEAAINFGIQIEAGNIKIDYEKYGDWNTQFLQSLKNQPRTITLEYDEKPEVGEDGYIIVK